MLQKGGHLDTDLPVGLVSFERLCPLLDDVGLGQRLHHCAIFHRLAASLPTKGTWLRSPAALCGGSSYDIYGTVILQIALKMKRHNAIATFIGLISAERSAPLQWRI